jgi:hypothetical protein
MEGDNEGKFISARGCPARNHNQWDGWAYCGLYGLVAE